MAINIQINKEVNYCNMDCPVYNTGHDEIDNNCSEGGGDNGNLNNCKRVPSPKAYAGCIIPPDNCPCKV